MNELAERSDEEGALERVEAQESALARQPPVSAYRWGGGLGLAFGILVASFGFWSALGIIAWGGLGVLVVLVGRIFRQRGAQGDGSE